MVSRSVHGWGQSIHDGISPAVVESMVGSVHLWWRQSVHDGVSPVMTGSMVGLECLW